MKKYRCLYNHDMSMIGCMKSPACSSFEQEITKEHVEYFVKDAADSQIDVFLCCPTALRAELWNSKVGGHWQEISPFQVEPDRADWNFSEAIYYRIRRYILNGGNPVQETYEAVKKTSMAFFFSFRMNDWHFVEMPDLKRYPTIDRFYMEHPEHQIGDFPVENPVGWPEKTRHMQNYLLPEVRKHYYDLLEELVSEFDIDGLELDFMRSPCYFPLDQLEKGTAVMTDFVRGIRQMLDYYGEKRGKHLSLSVRVPHSLHVCQQIGLDAAAWDKEELVEMINVSSSYFHSMELDLSSFREKISTAFIYAEMQGVVHNFINAYHWPSEMRTPAVIYETSAYHFLNNGADGISFFNFAITREIWQASVNPASRYAEPPVEIFQHILDMPYLRKRPKLYFTSLHSCKDKSLPGKGGLHTQMLITDDPLSGVFSSARFRVVCREGRNVESYPVTVQINGISLQEDINNRILFPVEFSEGEPEFREVRCFMVPLSSVQQNSNIIDVKFEAENAVEIIRLELALYVTDQLGG